MCRAFVVAGGVPLAAACQPVVTPRPASGPLGDITVLASPAFGGREAGTPGDDSAALFIARRYQSLHLRPAFHSVCSTKIDCPVTYYQFFRTADGVRQNVGAVIEGSDSSVRRQYVVIGAHFDHLGYSPRHARDPQNGTVLRPGADDNASGTAAVLALADRLSRRPSRRSIFGTQLRCRRGWTLGRDIPSLINGPGLLAVIEAAEQIARSAADQ